MQPEIVPVILAGGEGRRLRPLTSKRRPKPLLRPFSQYSLLQYTLMRVSSFAPPVIVTSRTFAGMVRQEAAGLGIFPRAVIAEPLARSTAAAIACAALTLGRESLMLVSPSDHYIRDERIFQAAVRKASSVAGDRFVLLAARPQEASPRYGYIETGIEDEQGVYPLRRFTEKPNARTARDLIHNGALWNTGMFLCRPAAFLKTLCRSAPAIYTAAQEAMEKAGREGPMVAPAAEVYARCPALAVDYAVMESLESGLVLPLETEWHDIGCWRALLGVTMRRRIANLNAA